MQPVDFFFLTFPFFFGACMTLAVSEPAPTGSFVQVGVNAKGVPQATYPKTSSASHCIRPVVVFGSLGLVLLLLLLLLLFTEVL